MKPLSIALLGSRGVPSRYGGYETLMDELAPRLVARGFAVTVYGRTHAVRRRVRRHRGARVILLPALRGKHLETPSHTFLSFLHARGEGFDAALVVNSANAMFLPLLRLAGIPTALNVDGIEKRRAKWGVFGRAVYALSERLACHLPDVLVTDAEIIRRHYLARYDTPSVVITYGVAPRPLPPTRLLPKLGLESRRYFLYVSRFEPENNPHRVVAAYREAGGDLPLVMVGDAPYAHAFIRSFTEGTDRRVLFPGAIYGPGYRELLSHALAYIQATEVGGTHPALVEAMGYGNCVLANDTPEHREVAGDTARYFPVRDPRALATLLDWARLEPGEAAALGKRAAERALTRHGWEEVADRYAALLTALGRGRCYNPPDVARADPAAL